MTKDEEYLDLKFNITLAVFFLAVSVVGFIGFAKLRADLANEEFDDLRVKTEALTSRVDTWLSMRKAEVSALANTPTIRAMDWTVSGPFLKAKHERMPWFYIFAQINPDGSYYNSKADFARGQNLSDRAHFKAAMEGRVYASDPVVSRTLGTDIVAVTSPVYRSDQAGADIIGVFGGMIDTSTIVHELGRFSNGPRSYAFAVNSTGIAIAHPDERRRGNINTKAVSLLNDDDAGLRALTERMLQGKQGWYEGTVDGRQVVASFVPVSEAAWFVATITDADHFRSYLRAVDYVGGLAFVLLCAAMALVVRFRRLEFRALNERRKTSEERNRAKSVFLASMSHDLRTPLNGILGYAQILLQEPARPPGEQRYLQGILSSGQHLLSLINRILDLSKIEAGKIELEPRPVDLVSLLQDLTRLFEVERLKYGAGFRASVDLGRRRVAILDPERLKQIVINLVVNAFKYGKQSEVLMQVTLREETQGVVLALEVRDAGAGMTADEVSRVFTPFEQINKRSEGTGLGLAIVNQLIALMRGSIRIDSAPGRGTAVHVELPVEFADEMTAASASAARGMPRGLRQGTPRILVVDDNPANLDVISSMLRIVGFDVRTETGVSRALEALAAGAFDLVITDLVMPERDGLDFIRAIRTGEHTPDVPILVASASAFPEDQARSLAAGANAFVSKPVEAIPLLQKIGVLLALEYVYDEDVAAAPTAAAAERSDPPRLRGAAARRAVEGIREAAELGQIRLVSSLLEAVPAPDLRAELRRVLDRGLREHDADLILRDLEHAFDDEGGEVPPRAASAA